MASGPPRVRCRLIRDADIEAVRDLLLKSFGRTREFWGFALQRLAEHPTPEGFPKYGYLLEVNGVPVGTVLLVSTAVLVDGQPKVRCNVSSWYVWPAFRAYAALLSAQAIKRKEATYLNISPLPHTFDIIAAQGYTRYCDGAYIAVPMLKLGSRMATVAPVALDIRPDGGLRADEIDLLLRHASHGLFSVVVTEGDRRYPFVFELSKKFMVVRYAYLIYSRGIDDFVRFAGPLGRFLARRGYGLVVLDANARVPGLIGRYAKATPKYFKGPDRPRLGDVADSERVVLGLRFPLEADAPH